MAITQPSDLNPGDVLVIGPAASDEVTVPLRLRLSRVLGWPAPVGECYLDGQVLDGRGVATGRRTILVRVDQLLLDGEVAAVRRAFRVPNNEGHHFPAPPAAGGSPS